MDIKLVLRSQLHDIDYPGIYERLQECYKLLKNKGLVKKQEDMGLVMGLSKSSITRWLGSEPPEKIDLAPINRLCFHYRIDGKYIDPVWVITGIDSVISPSDILDPEIPLSERLAFATDLAIEYATIVSDLVAEQQALTSSFDES